MYPMQYGTLHHRRESALKAMSITKALDTLLISPP